MLRYAVVAGLLVLVALVAVPGTIGRGPVPWLYLPSAAALLGAGLALVLAARRVWRG